MSNNYETVCVVKPDVSDDVIKAVVAKATSAIESGGGTVVKIDDWGRKRLAYPIAKKNEGHYFVIYYTSEPAVSKELERVLRLNEEVLRYQSIVLIEKKKKKRRISKKKAAQLAAAAAAAAPATAEQGGQANG